MPLFNISFSEEEDKDMDKYIAQTRCLLLRDDVDSCMVKTLITALPYLAARDPKKPIIVHIDSWGGSLDDCGAIIDTIMNCEAPVYTVAMGPAYSAAAIILCLGQPGRRAINPHGSVMLHTVKAGSDYDTPKNVEGAARFTARVWDTLMKDLCKATKLKLKEFRAAISAGQEFWYTAKEAKHYGLVDFIWKPSTARKIYREARDVHPESDDK